MNTAYKFRLGSLENIRESSAKYFLNKVIKAG
jgi:hypothetical protein